MRRRPQPGWKKAVPHRYELSTVQGEIGLVLSGGGARAAYQVGALRALLPFLSRESDPVSVIIGSSIGAINGLVFGACLNEGPEHGVNVLHDIWRVRTFRNSFAGSPSAAFFRAVRMAVEQYLAPGPKPTANAVFDPTPLANVVEEAIVNHGGLLPEKRHPKLRAVGTMTTLEGEERKPLLFLSTHKPIEDEYMKGASFEVCYVPDIHARHGFASAALPSVLPPVELETHLGKARLVDGGISQNVPVDPVVRLGASKVILIDISGRTWWMDQYGEPHDLRPSWEIEAKNSTFCFRPPETYVIRNRQAMGPILRDAVKSSTKKFIEALGPVWPVFRLLRAKLGEDAAYEAMSYVALDPDYLTGILELGYNETRYMLGNRRHIDYQAASSLEQLSRRIVTGEESIDDEEEEAELALSQV